MARRLIRVLIASQSAMVRAGLEAAIRGSGTLEFCGAFSLADLEMRLDETAADVLVVESAQFEEEWLTSLAGHAVVLLTDPSIAALALRAGVRAVLSRDATATEIRSSITSAALGLVTLQQASVDALLTEARPAPAALEEPLSPRELEVLMLLAEGLSNKMLAYRLGISEHTVKFHVTSVMAKLRAGSRTDAVMQGIRSGLILI